MIRTDYNVSPASVLGAFRKAMMDEGIMPTVQIIADGKMHSFSTNDEESDDAGRYILHLDGIPTGWFCDHRKGIDQKWHLNLGRALTDQEQAAQQAKIAKIRQKRDMDDMQRKEVAKAKSISIWKAAKLAQADHPYLVRKQVAPTATLREMAAVDITTLLGYVPKSKGEPLQGRLLVVPVKVDHGISTLELIDENGRKSAVAGGAKAKGYWAAAPLPDGDGEGLALAIGEGVATVLSVHFASAIPVVAALSAGNLLAVGREMRARYPKARLLILGDLGNGLVQAEQAARAVGGLLVVPSFTPKRADGDFNDMLVAHGADAVEQVVASTAQLLNDSSPDALDDIDAHGSALTTTEPIHATGVSSQPMK
jgi:phage/plasmid primase-like uncharacterized protein